MELYTGIDLHSNNGYYAIKDKTGKRIKGRRISNDLSRILNFLEPYREDIKIIAVESTYNWYWLVDGLKENGYDIVLANPSAMGDYGHLKNTDDKSDAFWIAEMMRLDILPTGYIYPKEERPVRDMLRRRTLFVHHRTAQMLSFQGIITRHCGITIGVKKLMKLKPDDLNELFGSDDNLIFTCKQYMSLHPIMTQKINAIEKRVLEIAKLKPEFQNLQSIPGIGTILGLTIMLETGDINRFRKAANYTSYCRLTKAQKTSNSKKKGNNNRKCGNKYLCWAFIEAVHCAIRVNKELNSYYQRKKARTGCTALATKAAAAKYSKGAYYIMRDQALYDVKKMFG